MIRLAAVLLAAVTPAVAQIAPLSFEAGKGLPLASGQWTYSATANGSVASYDSHLSLRCDRATRTVTVSRGAAAPAQLTIATDAMRRTLPVGGRLLANDPLLDAIAFSRGRFLVAGGSGGVIAVPSWPEAARSIEDCRS